MMMNQQSQQSRVLNELSSLVHNLLCSPPSPMELFSENLVAAPPSTRRRVSAPTPPPISTSGLASLMLGVSVTLIVCGSVTFFIGFLLMPWVLGLFIAFYLVALVSSVSGLGRTILSYAASAAAAPWQVSSSPRKDFSSWTYY